MKASQELSDLIEIAKFSQEPQDGFAHLRKVQRAKWAVEEIRRLRAKTNRLIDLLPKTEDLIKEEEI
jgi:hypothetical protein